MDNKIDAAQLVGQALSQTPQVHKLRKVSAEQEEPDQAQLKETAQQFEAIFIQQMFKEMRNTIPEGGLIERGNADNVYTQLQDAEAAKVMAERGGIGLADLMLQELLKQNSE